MKIFKKSLAMIILLVAMAFIYMPYEVHAVGEEVINAADVTVVIPAANANPDFNPISGDDTKYTVQNVHWYLYESPEYPSLDASSSFVAGKDYALRLIFTANPGYEFADDAVFTINGETTSCYGASTNREFIFYEIADATLEHTITFKDGSTIIGTDTVNDGGKVTRPATDPTKSGFAFVNWYADAGLNNLFDFEGTTINADTAIYAKWRDHSSVAVGITTGGKWSSNELNAENATYSINGTLPVNGSITLTATPDLGYHFVGWYEGIIGSSYFVDDHNSTLISSNATYTTTVADTLVIRAVFEQEVPQTIYVYYSAGDGNGGTFFTGTTNAESSYDVRTFESLTSMSAPSGKHFAGWNISDGGQITKAQLEVNPSITPETIGDELTRSLTFTAFYEDDPVTTYKVSFNSNGGSGTMEEVTGLTGTYTLPANGFTAPTNKQFKGWSLTNDGAIITTVEMTENRVVYAIWEDIPAETYTILEGANQTYTKGSNETITIKASGDLDKVIAIEIDNGNVVDPSNYELASGSTILTLKTSFLENSSLGEHTITIKYDYGEVETKLTIAEATDNNQTTGDNSQGTGNDNTNTNNSNNPQTNDNIIMYIYSLIFGIIGLASGLIYLKKNNLFSSK